MVVLEIEGKPEVAPYVIDSSRRRQRQSAGRGSRDPRRDRQVPAGRRPQNIGYWTDQNDWVSWDFQVKTPGKFDVEISSACDRRRRRTANMP